MINRPKNSKNAEMSINRNFWSSPSIFYHESSLKSSKCACFDGFFTFLDLAVLLSFEGSSKSSIWPKSEYHEKWLFWDPRETVMIAKKSKLNLFYLSVGVFYTSFQPYEQYSSISLHYEGAYPSLYRYGINTNCDYQKS